MLLQRSSPLYTAGPRWRSDGHAPAEPATEDLRTALRVLSPRAAPGADGVSAGLFDILGPMSRHLLLRAMCDAVAGRSIASVEACATSIAQMALKPGKPPESMSGWRPMSLMCALAKAFRRHVVWSAMGTTLRPLPGPILGFRPGRQPLEIAGCVSAALAKATESLYVVSLDVKCAFDRMSPALAAEALRTQGAHPAHIAAMLASNGGGALSATFRSDRGRAGPLGGWGPPRGATDSLVFEACSGSGGRPIAPEMAGC